MLQPCKVEAFLKTEDYFGIIFTFHCKEHDKYMVFYGCINKIVISKEFYE
jgi:hypothetical protein